MSEDSPLELIPEAPYEPYESMEGYLPNIYAQATDGQKRNKRHKSNASPGRGKPENLFIYKDFDTSLTKVKGPVKKLPRLEQTTG